MSNTQEAIDFLTGNFEFVSIHKGLFIYGIFSKDAVLAYDFEITQNRIVSAKFGNCQVHKTREDAFNAVKALVIDDVQNARDLADVESIANYVGRNNDELSKDPEVDAYFWTRSKYFKSPEVVDELARLAGVLTETYTRIQEIITGKLHKP